MDLQEIRKKLDKIDGEIVRLFEERMKLCADVAQFKIQTGKAVYDPQREKEKIETVTAMADGEFMKQAGGRTVPADDDAEPPLPVPADAEWTDGPGFRVSEGEGH